MEVVVSVMRLAFLKSVSHNDMLFSLRSQIGELKHLRLVFRQPAPEAAQHAGGGRGGLQQGCLLAHPRRSAAVEEG